MDHQAQFLNTKDVAKAFNCSLPTARKIMHRRDFPLIVLGRKMVVDRVAFDAWTKERHI